MWKLIISGVPHGSILGPILFNMFMCNVSVFTWSQVSRYADNNTHFVVKENITAVISALEKVKNFQFGSILKNVIFC